MASLTVVGTGIRLGQITFESQEAVAEADVVYSVVRDGPCKAMLRSLNQNVHDLTEYYEVGQDRWITYHKMVDTVVSAVRSGQNVCFALYGHPCVFAYPSRRAVEILRDEGFEAAILPGISAEDSLFADFLIDPAEHGCQSYDCSFFLKRRPIWDPAVALILWQPAVTGERRHMPTGANSDIQGLTALLLERYDGDHPAVLYEAAVHPLFDTFRYDTTIEALPKAHIPPLSTLYVPAKRAE